MTTALQRRSFVNIPYTATVVWLVFIAHSWSRSEESAVKVHDDKHIDVPALQCASSGELRPNADIDSDYDGTPDYRDEFPYVADRYLMEWTVDSLTVTYAVKLTERKDRVQEETLEFTRTEKTTAHEFTGTSKTVEKVRGASKGKSTLPLLGKRVSTSARVEEVTKDRAEVLKQYRQKLEKILARKESGDLQWQATVTFYNNSSSDARVTGFRVPIMYGSDMIAQATSTRGENFVVPANRPTGVFIAKVETQKALDSLSARDSVPQVRIDESQGRIMLDINGREVDMLALRQLQLQRTARFRIDDGTYAYDYQVARAQNGNGSSHTISSVLANIASVASVASTHAVTGVPFVVMDSDVRQIAGLKNDVEQGWWWVYEGGRTLNEEDYLSMPISNDVDFMYDVKIPLLNAEKLRHAGEHGNAEVQYLLGGLYRKGLTFTQEMTAAFNWYEHAAAQGHIDAANRLGEMCRDGEGTEKNERRAATNFRRAAEAGHVEAQVNLGHAYLNGIGVTQDYLLAENWLKQAAARDSVRAWWHLGCVYGAKDSPLRDLAKAFTNLQRAATAGHADATYNLAVMYRDGVGVPKNASESKKLMIVACEEGSVEARNELEGKPQRAVWYRRLMEGTRSTYGMGAAMYQYGVGKAYEYDGLKQANYSNAFVAFLRAAERGDADAQNKAGHMLLLGQGVDRNATEAAKWFRRACDQDHNDARYTLGTMYRTGTGVETNLLRAMTLFKLAAEENHGDAHVQLGQIYESGEGVARNYEYARKHYAAAADLGVADGMYRLGLMYETGRGIVADKEKAQEWFTKAAARGHDDANTRVKKAE